MASNTCVEAYKDIYKCICNLLLNNRMTAKLFPFLGPDHHSTMPVWSFMSPSEFCRFSVPFEMEGMTRDIPGGLPHRYHKACVQREHLVEQWQRNVKEAGLDRQQRNHFQRIVEERFQVRGVVGIVE